MQTHPLLLSLAVVFLMITVLFTSSPNITGFVPTSMNRQELDLTLTESKRFALSSDQGTLKIGSFSASGSIKGTGLVNIYLSDGKTSFLVYTNQKKTSSALSQITGLAQSELIVSPGELLQKVDELPQGYQTESGAFTNVCIETCNMLPELYNKQTLYLDAVITQPALVHISEITFSTHE